MAEFVFAQGEPMRVCGSSLRLATNQPGQQSNDTYLITEITELNVFKKVDVKLTTCLNKECLTICQPFPVDVGNSCYCL